LTRSKSEPAVTLNDGSCTVLGRRETLLGKDTQDMAQLLNCRKKNCKEEEKKIYIHIEVKKNITGIGIQLHAQDPNEKFFVYNYRLFSFHLRLKEYRL